MHVTQDLLSWLDKTPQPVALALGRVVRVTGSAERLDACIKAAEVVARYVAVTGLASAAATRPLEDGPPRIESLNGNLAFGVFDRIAREAAAVSWDHPLRMPLRSCLKSTKSRKAVAGQRLGAFIELRNELGHSITPADDARARVLLELNDPVGGLIELLEGLRGVWDCPLLVVRAQDYRRNKLVARVLFFVGEGEPIPQELELQDPIYDWDVPYLCTRQGLIPLSPGLVYRPRASDGLYGLHLLDSVKSESLRYKSVQDGSVMSSAEGISELAVWVSVPFAANQDWSPRPSLELVRSLDGRTLFGYLSGSEQPVGNVEVGPQTTVRKLKLANVREFEQLANQLGLGTAYRDVLYFLAGRGARAELVGEGVRVVTTIEPVRVLATIELTPTPALVVGLLRGALSANGDDVVETYEIPSGAPADPVVGRIEALLTGGQAS